MKKISTIDLLQNQKIQKREQKHPLQKNQTKLLTVKSQAKKSKMSMLLRLLSVLEFSLKNIVIEENASRLDLRQNRTKIVIDKKQTKWYNKNMVKQLILSELRDELAQAKTNFESNRSNCSVGRVGGNNQIALLQK